MSFGLNQNSGIASMERLLRYRGLIRFPMEHLRDAHVLDETRCALALVDGSTRVVQLVATAPLVDDDDYKLSELLVPNFSGPTVAFWQMKQDGDAKYVRVSEHSIEVLSISFAILYQERLPAIGVSAFSCGGNAVVLGADGQVINYWLLLNGSSSCFLLLLLLFFFRFESFVPHRSCRCWEVVNYPTFPEV